jgi:cyclophilin family peptidyl-prolyl cis-trans isomerase
MPRSRRYRKGQSQTKPEWGKNNPQTKAKNKKMLYIGVIAVAAIAVAATVMLGTGMFSTPTANPSPSPTTPIETASPSPSISPTPAATPLTSPASEYSENGTRVLLQTSMGDIVIQLRDDKPITSTNFKNIAEQGLYDNTVFHRIISGFMIQGGMVSSSVSTIPDEIGSNNRNTRGTIAMAKTNDPNSATSQFFINLVDNGYNIIDNAGTRFDSVYTAFGTVIQGMDVVDEISHVPVGPNPYTGENSDPQQTVTLIKAQILP